VVIFTLIALSPSADASVVAYQAQPLYTTSGDPDNYVSYQGQPLYTTSGNPANAVVSPPSAFDGVAEVVVETASGSFRGSGALLSTGRHLLTAAHLVTDSSGALDVLSASVFFDLPGGPPVEIAGISFIPHPDWDGNYRRGNDLAIITLENYAPQAAQRYDLYDDTDEVGQVGTKVGYGRSGQGKVEFDPETGQPLYPSGTKRSGQNKYDALADLMLTWLGRTPGVDFVPGSVLQYDFDNGLAANDGFGFFLGLPDLGLGEAEVLAALGDSGGPTFIDGKIAGITSYEMTVWRWLNEPPWYETPDITPFSLDSSFGEFVSDTRVSFYADWIRAVIPEPSSIIVWSLLSGLAIGAGFRRARRR
jgi:secreted trypsin-like serine protease